MSYSAGQVADTILFKKSVSFEPVKVNGRRIVAGYANVADVIDAQNEKVTKEALQRAWDKFSSNPKFCVSQLFHTNVPIASILLEPIIDSDGVTHKSGVDERGLYIVSEVRSDIKVADEVWKEIEAGKIRGFSIGGEYLSPPVTECVGGQCHNVVNDIELHEVSIVDRPANKVSLFNILKDCSLEKLSELTNKLDDKIILAGAIQVSKHPYSDGKYGIYHNGSNIVTLSYKEEPVPDGFKIVKEKCPQNEWINLFDLALLRPYSMKGEVITGSVPGGFKDASLLDKPNSVEESTLSNEKKNEVEPTVVSNAPTESATAPPVEENLVKSPLTLEIIAADLAILAEKITGIEGMLTAKSVEKEHYPWEQCISDRVADGYSQERAEKICGAIRAGTVNRKGGKSEWDAWLEDFEKSEKMVKSAPTEAKSTEQPSTVTVQPVEVKVEVPVAPPSLPKVEEVKPSEPVKHVEVPAGTTTPEPKVTPEPTEAKVVFRGQVAPKQEDIGKVDLLRLHKTPWRKLSE